MAVDTVRRSSRGGGRNQGDKIASGEPRGSSPLPPGHETTCHVRGSSPIVFSKMLCRQIVRSALTLDHRYCDAVRLWTALWPGSCRVAGEVGVGVHPPPPPSHGERPLRDVLGAGPS